MIAKPSHLAILFIGLLLTSFVGCADARQDRSEIPATIGEVQDADPDTQDPEEKPAATVDSGSKSNKLESAKPPKQDLVTLMKKEEEEFEKQTIEIPGTWKRLGKNHIWVDPKNKRVIVRGAICLQEGLLEMFACPRQTKEHEAIISVHAKAQEAHASMLAIGIKPGKPMTWVEEYFPVDGPVIDIEIWWTDKDGKLVKRRAQDMIRNTDTGKAMASDFVFGGSKEIYDPHHKRNDYLADYGPMINVANQPDAMIDVSIQSSAEAQGSLFEAFTENVPPVNTKVYVVLSDSGKRIAAKKGKPQTK
ncbi:YdjY domain-containing protein [Mariniblastus fucicola]|uniref:Secreted protein n=1 Tax=Mariniblastus fucicola TaxID=980251 RepID=A0A5B9PCL2_9BACT|nr:YdjY domain-containing protein [Mariniblastus fucicola]QEG23239.1 hypothetical protein MFFC18_31350 [Mariniblastus fucicola]